MKSDKSPKAQKMLKWHGNEEQTNISVYHMLQSYGVQSYQPLEDKGNNETHLLASTELSGLEGLSFLFPLMGYYQ